MPCLKIMTNISKTNIPKDFVSKIIPVLVEGVKKDQKVCTCSKFWFLAHFKYFEYIVIILLLLCLLTFY